jgi:hypothetical protein
LPSELQIRGLSHSKCECPKMPQDEQK